MGLVMVTVWFPPTKGIDIAKKAIEALKKFPADESIAIQLAQGLASDRQGFKSITISEVKEGKLEEALDRANEIVDFYTEIEGVTYKMDLMVTPQEAYARIGMKPPE